MHRKGATRVRSGELAVIPGAMGSYSYVVEGKGCEETFHTSSHGAGSYAVGYTINISDKLLHLSSVIPM